MLLCSKQKPSASRSHEGSAICETRPAFFYSIQYVKQSSVQLAGAFSQKTRGLPVEHSVHAHATASEGTFATLAASHVTSCTLNDASILPRYLATSLYSCV